MAKICPLRDDCLAEEGYMEIAEQIKAGRARLGLTQDELAQRVFVSRQTISSWENNKTYPDIQSLMLLSQTFGTSIDDLVKGDVTRMKERLEQDVKTLNRFGTGIALSVVAATIAIFATTWQDKHGWTLGQQIPTMLIAKTAKPTAAAMRNLTASGRPRRSGFGTSVSGSGVFPRGASGRIREPRRNTPPDRPNWRSSARHHQL